MKLRRVCVFTASICGHSKYHRDNLLEEFSLIKTFVKKQKQKDSTCENI